MPVAALPTVSRSKQCYAHSTPRHLHCIKLYCRQHSMHSMPDRGETSQIHITGRADGSLQVPLQKKEEARMQARTTAKQKAYTQTHPQLAEKPVNKSHLTRKTSRQHAYCKPKSELTSLQPNYTRQPKKNPCHAENLPPQQAPTPHQLSYSYQPGCCR